MQKTTAISLEAAIAEAERRFSDPGRECNYDKSIFVKERIHPLSDTTAAVVFDKTGGKKAIAFFYRIKDYWRYFFPSDSHIVGMSEFGHLKREIEKINFPVNFEAAAEELIDRDQERFLDKLREGIEQKRREAEEIPF